MRFCTAVSIWVVFVFGAESPATICSFTFNDPMGDQGQSSADVTRLDMSFDNEDGSYVIVITADANNPFHDDFRINVNLFNPDTGSANQDPSFFVDSVNDFLLAAPVTEMILAGTNPRLRAWHIGDRVAINSIPFGNPVDGGIRAFYTGVLQRIGLPTFQVEPIGESPYYTTVVPEPAMWLLLPLLGLAGCACGRRS